MQSQGDADFFYENQNIKLPNRPIYFFFHNKRVVYILDKDKAAKKRGLDNLFSLMLNTDEKNGIKMRLFKKENESLTRVIEKKKKELMRYKALLVSNPSYKSKVKELQSQITSLKLSQSLFSKRISRIKSLRHFYKNELLAVRYFRKKMKSRYDKKVYKQLYEKFVKQR